MASRMSRWPLFVPPVAIALLAAGFALPAGALLDVACAVALLGAVTAAVHHAEVIAHRVGEPFGTLVLALAVTAIEVSTNVSSSRSRARRAMRWLDPPM